MKTTLIRLGGLFFGLCCLTLLVGCPSRLIAPAQSLQDVLKQGKEVPYEHIEPGVREAIEQEGFEIIKEGPFTAVGARIGVEMRARKKEDGVTVTFAVLVVNGAFQIRVIQWDNVHYDGDTTEDPLYKWYYGLEAAIRDKLGIDLAQSSDANKVDWP